MGELPIRWRDKSCPCGCRIIESSRRGKASLEQRVTKEWERLDSRVPAAPSCLGEVYGRCRVRLDNKPVGERHQRRASREGCGEFPGQV